MKRWKEVAPEVWALLNDKDRSEPEYDDDDLIRWWNNAQMRLATAKPQTRHQVYRQDDGNAVSVPQYHYKPVSVFVKGSSEPLPRLRTELALLERHQPGFYLYEDKIVINGLRNLPGEWLYVYHSHFPEISDEKSEVYVPPWAHEACVNYVGMQAMMMKSVDDARYRQFTSPPDATGNPLHNPYLKVAKYLEERFFSIIHSHVDDDENYR